MKRIEVSARGETAGSPARVYALLKDSTTWPSWSLIGSCEMVRGGQDGPHGVGAQRVFRTGFLRVFEEIPELVADRRVSYLLLSGMPMRGYRADIDLEPTEQGGTRIVWHSAFSPAVAGTGWFFRWFMTRVLRRMVADLCAATGGAS